MTSQWRQRWDAFRRAAAAARLAGPAEEDELDLEDEELEASVEAGLLPATAAGEPEEAEALREPGPDVQDTSEEV